MENVVIERRSKDERFGHEIGYGAEQTFACWLTDGIDPPVSRFLQNRFGNKAHEVTNKHVWYGEILGDTQAFFSYLLAKRLFTKPIDAVSAQVEKLFSKRFTKQGQQALADWANEKHVSADSDEYKKRLKIFTAQQAENTVDSLIIATSATLGNVAVQRATGNKQALAVILGSKLVGAAATLSLMFGARTVAPESMSTLDHELNDRYFSKLIKWTKRQFGLKEDAGSEHEPERETQKPRKLYASTPPFVEVAAGSTLASLATQKLLNKEAELVELIPKSAGIGAVAGAVALGVRHFFPTTAKTFDREINQRYVARSGRPAPATAAAEKKDIIPIADAPGAPIHTTKHAAAAKRDGSWATHSEPKADSARRVA